MSLKLRFSLFALCIGIIPLLLLGWLRESQRDPALEHAGLSPAQIAMVSQELSTGLLASTLILAIAAVFFTIAAVRTFTEPITLLTEAMRRFRRDRTMQPLPVIAKGEIRELTETFNDMAMQLQERIEKLKEADRAKDEFIAILAHELRNPMAPIVLSLELLKRQDVEDPEVRETLDVVGRQVGNMRRLLDNLLDVSRLERGRIELRKEALDLCQELREAEESAAPFIAEQQHRLVVSLPHAVVPIEADPVRINQVFVNLLKNAAEHTEPGGTIWVTCRREGDWASVSIRDEGKGIAPEMIPHLFKLFSRGGEISRRSPGGLGIGLYLVKMFTELHGGRVSVRSKGEGKGAEFTIRLPLRANVH